MKKWRFKTKKKYNSSTADIYGRGGNMKGETDLGQLSKQVSTRDLPMQMTLKYRQDGQGKEDEYEMLKATHRVLIKTNI